ncbi:MAG: AAA family ATPase [Clostridiales bacterium]|nr:AAA family ATPase [Clostridiales bacterium]
MLDELYLSKVRFTDKEQISGYLQNLPVVAYLDELNFCKPVTFLVGENGTGKSTLIEALAVKCGFNPEGGTKNFRFATNETHSELYRYLKITRGYKRERDGFFLRAESFYNAASYIEELDEIPASSPKIRESYGGESLHRQSHGESFMSLALHRFGGQGLYILDEPEAALSPARQMALLSRIHQLVKQDSQFIIATHSPILMAYPDADIYSLSGEGIRVTPYQDTEHYRLMKQFLDHPDSMLRYLLD